MRSSSSCAVGSAASDEDDEKGSLKKWMTRSMNIFDNSTSTPPSDTESDGGFSGDDSDGRLTEMVSSDDGPDSDGSEVVDDDAEEEEEECEPGAEGAEGEEGQSVGITAVGSV